MQEVIEKINRLLELCSAVPDPLNIPQIVVVGAQSTGKSSILENIVGASFLPRGTGMVTRRPLMIQMVPHSEQTAFCTFGHNPGVKYNISEVEEEIRAETERILQTKHDVSAIPIVLKIYQEKTLPLTLVDLPGLVKVRTEHQPEGIVRKIEEITKSYLRNRNAVILAVTQAGADIASSDGLMAAKEVDPGFERTLCVLTKVDLMDPGTDVVPVLQGRVLRVKLGFVPVVCRGELSVRKGTEIEEALGKEREFFASHPSYARNQAHCGIAYLTRRLHLVLRENIERAMPQLQEKIEAVMAKTEAELQEIGEEVKDKKQAFMQIAADFKHELEQRVSGAPAKRSRQAEREIVDGARISHSLDTVFSKFIRETNAFDATEDEIETVVLNASGVFGAQGSFQGVSHYVALAAERIRPHAVSAAEKAQMEMQGMVEKILAQKSMSRFPKLKKSIHATAVGILREKSTEAIFFIERLLEWNTQYIRAPSREAKEEQGEAHKETREESPSEVSARDGKRPWPEAEITGYSRAYQNRHGERAPAKSLKRRISEHVEQIKEVVIEQVPKIVVTEIVGKTLRQVQKRIIEALYDPEQLEHLLEEEAGVAERRAQLEKARSALKQAQEIVRGM